MSADGVGGHRNLPAIVTALGPFDDFAFRVHLMMLRGRCAEALQAADDYEAFVRAAGDRMTVTFLNQGRMYSLRSLGRFAEALSAGLEALRVRRELGWVVGQAKTLADVSELHLLVGDVDTAVHDLALATSLLDRCRHTDFRYRSACTSVADAARAAELYELAEATLYRPLVAAGFTGASVAEAFHRPEYADIAAYIVPPYASLQLEWGLRLEQLGRTEEAAARLRRCADLSRSYLAVQPHGDHDPERVDVQLTLSLAKLGETAEVLEHAPGLVMALRRSEQYSDAIQAHLAYGVALAAHGETDRARRELVAAEQLFHWSSRTADQLAVRYELVRLATAAMSTEDSRRVLAATRAQADRLWELRLRGVAMLRQAGQRQVIEAERADATAALLRDELTGIGNRRRYDQILAGLDRPDADPDGGALTLLLVDLDEFKQINDRYSHGTGDQVLAELGAILRSTCRPQDSPVRFGGDEFAVFVRAELPVGLEIAERIRRATAERRWNRIALGLQVTVSIGAAAHQPDMTGRELFDAADRNLYQAKRHGRNRLAS